LNLLEGRGLIEGRDSCAMENGGKKHAYDEQRII
jgi:hypothetical protein